MKMKSFLLPALFLMIAAFEGFGQDTLKIQIDFQTKDNQFVSLYKEEYVSQIVGTSGYSSNKTQVYNQTTTTLVPIINAPNMCSFNKNIPLTLVMTDNTTYKTRFSVDTRIDHQKWMLIPAGSAFKTSKSLQRLGYLGLFVSGIIYGAFKISDRFRTDKYNSDLALYKSSPGFYPEPPKLVLHSYQLPIAMFCFSTTSIIIGKILYIKKTVHLPNAWSKMILKKTIFQVNRN